MRRALHLLALLLACLCGGAQAWGGISAENRAFETAAKSFQISAWDFADKRFGEFVQKYPKSPLVAEAILFQAEARYHQGRFADALQLLTDNRDHAGMWQDEYLFVIAQCFLRSSNYQAAADGFASLIQEYPSFPRKLEATLGQATALCRLDQGPRAIALLDATNGILQVTAQSSATNRLVFWGDLLLAEAQLQEKQWANAGLTLERIDRLPLDDELSWRRDYLRGRLQLATGRLPEALETSSNLVALAQTVAKASSSSAAGLVQADQARSYGNLDSAALLPQSWAFRGSVLERLKSWPEAIAAYTNNLATNAPPDQQRYALLRIATVNLEQTNAPMAIQALEGFLTDHRQSEAVDMAVLAIGELLLEGAAGTNNEVGHGLVAGSPATNLLQQAMARFDQLLNTYSNSPLVGKALLDKGWCLWIDEQYEPSAAVFRQAAEKLPTLSLDQAVARFKVADSEFMLTNYAAAISNYQVVVSGYDSKPEVREVLREQALYQIVRAALAATNLLTASNAMDQLLTGYPNSVSGPSCLLLVGQGHLRRDDPAGAQKLFLDFETHYPTNPLLPKVRLAVARTYEQQGSWRDAITQYDEWLKLFPRNPQVPDAEFARALAYYHAGQPSNSLSLLTNFVARYSTNELARRAQWWIADYYFGLGDYQSAEQNYQLVYKSTNWSPSDLTYHAQMMAGLAAVDRQSYKDAFTYFTNLMNNPNCPSDLKYRAYFASADALISMDANPTNRLLNLDAAIQILRQIPATNRLAAGALGNIGNCYFQWAATDASKYADASNAYAQVLVSPRAEPGVRNQARIGLGNVAESLARARTGNEQTRLREQAYDDYLAVFLEAGPNPDSSDPYWVKLAGVKAGGLAEDLQRWDAAYKIYKQLEKWYPSLNVLLDPKILKICRNHPEACEDSSLELTR